MDIFYSHLSNTIVQVISRHYAAQEFFERLLAGLLPATQPADAQKTPAKR
jgi:hypothetical protein